MLEFYLGAKQLHALPDNRKVFSIPPSVSYLDRVVISVLRNCLRVSVMKKILFIVLVVALGVVAYLQWQGQQQPVVMLLPAAEAPSVPSVTAEPRYPIPAPSVMPPAPQAIEQVIDPTHPTSDASVVPVPMQVPVNPLPVLNASDAAMGEVFSALFASDAAREVFNLDEIIRRFVVTIDNLPNKKLPRQHVLVTRAAGPFQVMNEADSVSIAPDNAARYAPFLSLAIQADAAQLVAIYVRFYALFQEAYAEVASPGAYFNDRLVDVIEHLLNTPVVDEPIPLVKPKVLYQYADAELEARSAGQKILLRMGNAGAEQIKVKLREIRRLLVDPALLQEKVGQAASPPPASADVE